ncbi:MAG: hypothetical protein V1906_02610, partial [Candidatus Woesearchaeota archaeon]
GCAKKLRDIFPDIPIAGFSVMRSIYPKDFVSYMAPCKGKIIYYSSGKTFRDDKIDNNIFRL